MPGTIFGMLVDNVDCGSMPINCLGGQHASGQIFSTLRLRPSSVLKAFTAAGQLDKIMGKPGCAQAFWEKAVYAL